MVCYYLVQNFMSSPLLSKHVKMRMHITITLAVVLYRRETWSLTLRVEHRLRVFENMVTRKHLVRREMKWWENGENCIMKSFINCTLRQVQLE
jgi:hypothetical protein